MQCILCTRDLATCNAMFLVGTKKKIICCNGIPIGLYVCNACIYTNTYIQPHTHFLQNIVLNDGKHDFLAPDPDEPTMHIHTKRFSYKICTPTSIWYT